MTSPKSFDKEKMPSILWRGERWPIPELAVRQLEEIYEPIERLTEALRKQDEEVAAIDPANMTSEEKFTRGLDTLERLYKLSRAQFADLKLCVYVGLTRAHTELTRDEFDDAPAAPAELLRAFMVVRKQSRMYEIEENAGAPDAKQEEPAKPGEE